MTATETFCLTTTLKTTNNIHIEHDLGKNAIQHNPCETKGHDSSTWDTPYGEHLRCLKHDTDNPQAS